MSELAKRDDSDDRRPAIPGAAAKPNPLRQLPPEWREPVLFFFTVWSDTLKGTSGLVARFRLWMKRDQMGLTLAEAKAAMQRLMRPEHAAAIQFPGQLMAALAEAVVLVRNEAREAVAKEEQRRRLAAEAERFQGEGEPIGRQHVPTL